MQRKAKEYASVDTIGANLGSKKLSKRMTSKETKLSIERLAEQD